MKVTKHEVEVPKVVSFVKTTENLPSGSNLLKNPFRMTRQKMLCICCFTELTRSTLEDHETSDITVETKRLKAARRLLTEEQKQFLILAGHDGDGLSTLGKDLLLEFPDRDQYIVMEPAEVLPCILQSGEKQVILFADDVFGTTYFDEKRFEEWRRIMNRIFSYIKRNKAILILSLHLEMTQDSKCKQFYDFYQDSVLNISDPDLQLNYKEMSKILKRNIVSQMDVLKIEICQTKQEDLAAQINNKSSKKRHLISEETIDDIAKVALPSGFPGEVAYFLQNVDNLKKGITFFSTPPMERYNEIDRWQTSNIENDINKLMALIAVFVYVILNFNTFEIHIQSEKEHRSYLASCAGKSNRFKEVSRIRTKMPKMMHILKGFAKRYRIKHNLADSVRSGVRLLLGRYLKEMSKGQYEFASESVEKVVAVICAREYPVEVCTFSSRAVFSDIIGPESSFEDKELHISVNEKTKDMCLAVIKRLQSMLMSNKVLEFIQHPAMRVPWFAMQFIKHLKQQKNGIMEFVILKDNKSDRNVLSLSLDYPYKSPGKTSSQCLAEDILLRKAWLRTRKENAIFANRVERETLEKCCEMQWEHSYFRLTAKLRIPITKQCLLQAVRSTSYSIVRDLVTQNINPLSDDDCYSALRCACEKYKVDVEDTQKIFNRIKKKVSVDYSSETQESIIHEAGRNGDVPLLGKVITFYNDKSIRNQNGQTCIHLATEGNHSIFVSQALKFGVSQRICDTKGELPIHYASKQGLLEIAEILLSQDPGIVTSTSNTDSTPLHLAAENNYPEMCGLLLNNKANMLAMDNCRQTPAYYAAASKKTGVLECFLKYGLDVYLKTANGDDLFAVVTKAGNTAGMTALLNEIKEVKQRRRLLDECLFNVLRESEQTSENLDNKCNGLMRLIGMGADPNSINKFGTPLIQAALKNKCATRIVRLLINKGACIRKQNYGTEDTALHTAVKEGNKAAVELILTTEDKEALLKLRNKNGEIPLHIAADLGMTSIVSLLKSESTIKIFFVKDGRCFTALQLAQKNMEHSLEKEKKRNYMDVIHELSQSNF